MQSINEYIKLKQKDNVTSNGDNFDERFRSEISLDISLDGLHSIDFIDLFKRFY